ncbi:phage tail protein [Streptomyces cyaneofuscatus]|uniref:phage tail protein n=1 Tax=Streptomyces cyaneofuscatus TaxID=66883 RepID=UPI0013D92B2F|nr:phage tail protein [Streptomyces cyaneofuscatus]NDZ63553.1 phage tail protein [Streptomyces cyaneofuscatus]
MLPIPPAALDALTGACGRPYRAEWSVDGGRSWTPCGVVAGSAQVQASRTQTVRYTASATLTGVPLGRHGINPISTNVRLWQGITPARTDTVWIPAGRYTVNRPKATRTGIQVELDGLEDEIDAARFPVPRALGPDSARVLVEMLLGEALPGVPVSWRPGIAPDTLVPQIVADEDRWAVLAGGTDSSGNATGIAAALAAELYVDARGMATIGPVPTLADPVVWRIGQGMGGALVEPQAEQTAEGLVNLWSVSGDAGDGAAAVGPVHAWDSDPGSLTYAGPDPVADPLAPQREGLTWVRVRAARYTSALITDPAQAYEVAHARLADSLGVQNSLTVQAACNPAIEPGDVIEVETLPDVWERHLVDQLSYTLGSAAMSCTTRTTPRRVT